MDKFPLKGSREAAAEGNNYITAYQTVMKKVCNSLVLAVNVIRNKLHTKYVLVHKLFVHILGAELSFVKVSTWVSELNS